MLFADEAKIFIKAGDGGNGAVSFHRAKYVPDGGPDGGNGGSGGDVVVKAVGNLNTLIDFKYKRRIVAENGKRGGKANRTGYSGDVSVIEVPIGTQVFDSDGEMMICDLDQDGKSFILARGGRGGAGNRVFKTSIDRAPKKAMPGEEGESSWIILRLKLFCDVGLVGFPNVGKSSLLASLSNAKPKVADYPFATMEPMLGFVEVENYDGFVMSDIPGLIEGASSGHGLGDRFLRHIERCKVILHILDSSREDVIDDYFKIRKELESYSKVLAAKPEIIALSKVDLCPDIKKVANLIRKKIKVDVSIFSSYSKFGLFELKESLYEFTKKN